MLITHQDPRNCVRTQSRDSWVTQRAKRAWHTSKETQQRCAVLEGGWLIFLDIAVGFMLKFYWGRLQLPRQRILDPVEVAGCGLMLVSFMLDTSHHTFTNMRCRMKRQELRTKTIPLRLLTNITRDCGPSGFAVYSVLLCHARTKGDDIGKSFPGKELISKEANISPRTTTTAINALVGHRYILLRKKKALGGYYSNVYWIAWIRVGQWQWHKAQAKSLDIPEHSHKQYLPIGC